MGVKEDGEKEKGAEVGQYEWVTNAKQEEKCPLIWGRSWRR